MGVGAGPLFPALIERPEQTALRFPEASLTYGELDRASAAVATAVAGAGVVAVLAEPRLETAVAVVGALRAGVPLVPLNPRSGERELAHMVADSDPDLLLLPRGASAPGTVAKLPRHEVDPGSGPDSAEPGPEPVDPEAAALIVYTSGTTGAPKGAVLPRRALATNLDALAEAWGWTDADTVTHGLPLFHVHGLVVGVLGPVRRGGTAHHVGRFSPEGIEAALIQGATMVFGVPTMYRRLAEAAEQQESLAAALGSARLLVSGSAALPVAEHNRLRQLTGRVVVERYGMTETLMNTAVRVDGEPGPGTVGPPLTGVDLRLVDDDATPVTACDGETMGEVEVRGPNLFLGYLNRPEETSQTMRDGWFRTGDMAVRGAHGYVRLVGRRSTDLIKSGGYKIGAGEIEAALREHPAVQDAAVIGEPDADLGERVAAWVVLRDDASVEAAELIEQVSGQLAPHKRPRVVRFTSELPRNELGKVQKQRLGADD
jgi:malonyl-CoA/methylmalonyl-CoA synthetase